MNKKLRDASSAASKKFSEVEIDLRLRKDVFLNVKAFSITKEAKKVNYEQNRFIENTLRDGKRNGLLLANDGLQEFKKNKKRISKLGEDYLKCLIEDTSYIWADEKELSGVPNDVIESMEKDDSGNRKVTTKSPHYNAVMDYCSNEKTRLTMMKTYETRCVEENTPRIEELVTLRHRQATLLGLLVATIINQSQIKLNLN